MEDENDDIDDKTAAIDTSNHMFIDFKQNLTGYVYQLKLLLLFLWRGLKSTRFNKFQLGTELKEAEKFDDAIFIYETPENKFVRYMQAKYSRFDKNVLKFKDFVSGWSGARCNLKKYFISYRKIKQRPYQMVLDDLTICTNIPFGNLTLSKNNSDILAFEEVSEVIHDEIFEGMKKYQLKKVISSPILYEELKHCTNLNLLAKELTTCIFKDSKSFNLDLQDYWISGFFNVLNYEKIIEQREYYKLSAEDPKHSNQVNQDIQEFTKYLVEKMLSKDGIKNENVKFDTNFIDRLRNHKRSGASIATATVEEIAEILVESISNNALPLPDKTFDIDNLFSKEKSFFFTDNFIHSSDTLSVNAKNFRSILMKAVETEVTKNLVNQQIQAFDALNGIKIFGTRPSSICHNVDEGRIAKELVLHIFYTRELTNIFKPEYTFLKDVFNLVGMNEVKFTKNFAKNDTGSFRKTFLKLYAEEKLKNTTIKIKQNLLKYSTIIDQLKKSYNKAKTTKEKVLKLDQTSWRRNKIEGLMEALNGSVFIAKSERDMIEFNDIFTNVHQRIPNKIAEKFKKELQEKFKSDFEKLKDYKVEYVNYPPCFMELIEDSTDINKDIQTFRQKMFIVNTPFENDLMTDISKDMGDKFNLLEGDTMSYSLFQEVLRWAKEKEDTLLSISEAKSFMNNIEIKLSEKFEAGCSLQYMNKLEEYSVTYKEILDELLPFLGLPPFVANQNKIFHIQTDEILLMAIKVHQTLSSFSYFEKKDYFIFNPLTSLIRMEKNDKHVSKAFASTSDILIIVDKEISKGLQEFCNIVCEIITAPSKKVIIISNEISQLVSALKALTTQELNNIKPKKIIFGDLTQESQNMILQNTRIVFQGNDILLHKFMNEEEASTLIDPNTLERMINGEKILVGEPIKSCKEIENDMYRPRQIRLIEVNDTLYEEKNLPEKNLFAIEEMDPQTLLITKRINGLKNNHLTNNYIILLEKSGPAKHFQQICEQNFDYCVHWLKMGSEKLIWFYSYVPSSMKLSSKFQQYIKRNKEYVLDSFFVDYIKQNRMVVIADSAGMGKSTILTHFSKEFKGAAQWIIRINLNQYTPVLRKILRSPFKNNEHLYLNFDEFNPKKKDFGKIILESLITLETHENKGLTFENQIFNHFFVKRGILFMFDGFDEINPDYGDIVLNLLQILKKNNKHRIWITSRTNFKQTLEDTFDTFAYDMKLFDRKDQEIFLKQFWICNYKKENGIDMPNQDRLHLYIAAIIDAASATIGDIIGIPLQTKMLAEIFQEKHESDKTAWVSCFDYVKTKIQPAKLCISAKFSNIFSLYETFITEKIFKYFLQEKGIVELSKPFAQKIKEDVYAAEYYSHKLFGYLALIDQNLAENLITDIDKENIKKWQKNFDLGVENIGIISTFNSDRQPLFTHLTFAEYFAACFLVDKLCTSSSNIEHVFKAANEIFKKAVPIFVECFKHRLSQEIKNKEFNAGLNETSVLKFVIKHGFLNCVNVFINCEELNDGFPTTDEYGEKILKYAVEQGPVDVLVYIVFYMCYLVGTPDSYLRHLVSAFNNFSFTSNADAKIKSFFEAVKRAVERRVIPKTYPNLKTMIKKSFISRDININSFTEDAVRSSKRNIILEFSSFFSCNSIIIVLKALKVRNFTSTGFIFDFLKDICSRSDLREPEKMQIFESILADITEKQNKIDVTRDMLMLITGNDCPGLLEQMLKKKLEYDDKLLVECFKLACRHDEFQVILKLLPYLKKLSGVNGWSYHYSPLYYAILYETRLETISYLYETIGASIDSVNKDGETFLFDAVQFKCNIKTINYFCEKGADPNYKYNENMDSPWETAVKYANDDIIKYFLSKFNNLDFNGRYFNMVEILRAYYNDPINFKLNQKIQGKPLLYLSILDKNVAFCKFLIRKSPDIHLKDTNETALNLARDNKLDDIVILLSVYGACAEEYYRTIHKNFITFSLLKSKENENNIFKDIFMDLLGECGHSKYVLRRINKATINQKDENGNTLLHLAARDGDEKAVFDLLEQGAYYNIKNNNEETPELVATPQIKIYLNEINKLFCEPSLIERHLTRFYNAKNTDGKTLLHYAVKNNNFKALDILLTQQVDINETDNNNRTPLYYAVKNNNIEMLKRLLKKRRIHFPMLFPAINECSDMVSCIDKCLTHVFNEEIENLKEELEHAKNNHDFNFIISVGSSKVMCVAGYAIKYSDLLLYLLQKGVVVQVLNILKSKGDKRNVQHMRFGNNGKIAKILSVLIQIAEYVLSNKYIPESIINYYNCNFIEALGYITTDQLDADKVIVNVRFNFEDIHGATLLHIAAIADEEKIAEWLINEKNADSNLKDHDDNTVYDLAVKHDSQKVISLLEQTKKNII